MSIPAFLQNWGNHVRGADLTPCLCVHDSSMESYNFIGPFLAVMLLPKLIAKDETMGKQ